MIAKLSKFVQSLEGSKKYNKYFLYAQIIRNERAKRKLTLAEMAKGICSVSYLCKFEKNDIIADEAYIRAIFEKVNLDFDLVGRNILVDGVKNALRAYLANDLESIEILYNSIDDSIFNAQNNLIKCFYYLTKQNYVEFKDTIKTIDNIKDTLLLDDVGVFFFLVVQYYIDTRQYREARTILRETEHLKYDIPELNWLILEQNFNVGFELRNQQKLFCFYDEIAKTNHIAYPNIRKTFSRAKILYSISERNYKKALNEFELLNYKTIPENYHLDLKYWQLATYLRGEDYIRVFDEINDNKLYLEPKFLCLFLLSAFYIKDDNYVSVACEVAENYSLDEVNRHDKAFIKFMLLYLNGKYKHEYVEFLKEKILPTRKKFTHFIYSPIYLEMYVDYLRQASRYKEAAKLLVEEYEEQFI